MPHLVSESVSPDYRNVTIRFKSYNPSLIQLIALDLYTLCQIIKKCLNKWENLLRTSCYTHLFMALALLSLQKK